MANMPVMAEMYKARYCQGDHGLCARHVVFENKGPGSVPEDLFPNDVEYAQQLIAN